MNTTENAFKLALLEAVDDGLLTLGESGRKAVYFHLQNSHALKREDIPNKPETFAEGLRKIFGLGAEVIERAIVKSLYSKLGIEYEQKKDHDFLAYLNDAVQMTAIKHSDLQPQRRSNMPSPSKVESSENV